MSINRKYLLYYSICTASQLLIVILFYKWTQFTALALTAYAILTFGLFMARTFYTTFEIIQFIKLNQPKLFEKYSFRFFKYRLAYSWIMTDKQIRDTFNDQATGFYIEHRIAKKYFVITFFTFLLFAIIVISSNPQP